MKIQVLSDLHLEFMWPDNFKSFLSMLDPEGVDVLVLAGDICTNTILLDVLYKICQKYSTADVVYVHGNHEFYGSTKEIVASKTKEASKQIKNLHWLDCTEAVIAGQRFIGAPLWFEFNESNEYYEQYLNDFHVIYGFKSWVYDENHRAMDFFAKELKTSDIVITHHLPSNKSVAKRFENSELSRFYVCDLESLIKERNPKLWIHGHTHDSFDYQIESSTGITRIVCNPHGYWPNDINPDFLRAKIIEV